MGKVVYPHSMEQQVSPPSDSEPPTEEPRRGRLKTWWNNLGSFEKTGIVMAGIAAIPLVLVVLFFMVVIAVVLVSETTTAMNPDDLLPDPIEGDGWITNDYDIEPENHTEGFMDGARRVSQNVHDGTEFATTIMMYQSASGARDLLAFQSTKIASIDGAVSQDAPDVGDEAHAYSSDTDSLLIFRENGVVAWVVISSPFGTDWNSDASLLAVHAQNIIDRM